VTVGRAKPWLVAVTLAAVAGYCAYVAYPTIFTGSQYYDDEGYLLATFRAYVGSGGLYSSTYAQYGPGYYSLFGTLFQLTGADLMSLAPGRVTALSLLAAASLAGAVAVWLATRRLLLAVAAQLFFTAFLKVAAAAEPLHPGGYLVLLLALLAVTCFLPGTLPSAAAPAALGAIAALMLTTKINVGAFAVLGCLAAAASAASSRWLRAAAWLLVAAVPLGLTVRLWAWEGMPAFALVVALGGVVARAVVTRGPVAPVDRSEIVTFIAAVAIVSALLCVPVLFRGTSPAELLDGTLLAPARFAGVFVWPVVIDLGIAAIPLGLSLLLLCAAVLARRLKEEPAASRLAGALKLVGGLAAIFASSSYRLHELLPALLVLAGLVAVPISSYSVGAIRWRRVLLLVAVLQPLHAYPVAGSQVTWGCFLLVLVAFVNVGDGISELALAIRGLAGRLRWLSLAPVAASALLLVAVASRDDLSPTSEYLRFNALPPLGLPGDAGIHVTAFDAYAYGELTRILSSNCDSFYSLPGLNSFYVWAQMQPPTRRLGVMWHLMFDEDMQAAVIQDLDRFPGRLCVLRNLQMAFAVQQGRPFPTGPLVRYVARYTRSVGGFGAYEVLRLPSPN
jgi:hypothetical protein